MSEKVDSIINDITKDLKELNKDGSYKYKQKDLAKKYNISDAYISKIIKDNNLSRNNWKLSPTMKNNIIKDLKALNNDGSYKYTQKEISEKYNVDYTTIYEIIKERKLFRTEKYPQNTKNNIIKDLKALNNDGSYKYSYKKISKTYNISITSISKIAKNNGLTRYTK